ncbi:hypothetical protein HK101_006138 [Irineochytrium annulatum]|nr:hypothetical protein HK101_006138 [Irineochytrium annulatum]
MHVLDYLGDVHGEGTASGTSEFVLSLDRKEGLSVDAEMAGNEGRMINDYRGVPLPENVSGDDVRKKGEKGRKGSAGKGGTKEDGNGTYRKPNVQFDLYRDSFMGEVRMGIFTLRRIGKGEELLLSYGKGFWSARGLFGDDQRAVQLHSGLRWQSVSQTKQIFGIYRLDNQAGSIMVNTSMDANSTITLLLVSPTGIANNGVEDSYTRKMRLMLLAAEQLAVADVNARHDILPNVTVRTVSLNNWDPNVSDSASTYDAGGYASVKMHEALVADNIAGVIEGYFSKTAIFTAEVVGYHQKPHCDFKGMGKHVLQLLNFWNVRRIAVVQGTDLLSTGYASDIIQTLTASGVTCTTITISAVQQSSNDDFTDALNKLVTDDLRYIFVSGTLQLVRQFYFAAWNVGGLVDDGHVWISYNPPWVEISDITPTTAPILHGFQLINYLSPPINSPPFQSFNASWARMNALNPLNYTYAGGLPGSNTPEAYDCVMVMLTAFDRLIREGGVGVKELGDGSLGARMGFGTFANTGYNGTSWEPVQLNSYETIVLETATSQNLSPQYFVSLNATNYLNYNVFGVPYAYGVTDLSATKFISLATPTFFGGSSIPPPDRPRLFESFITPTSTFGILTYLLSLLGFLLAFAAVLHHLIRRRGGSATPGGSAVAWLQAASSWLGMGCIMCSVGRQAGANCAVQMSLFGGCAFRSHFVLLVWYTQCMGNPHKKRAGLEVVPLIGSVGVMLLINIALLYVAFGINPSFPIINGDEIIYICSLSVTKNGESPVTLGVMYILNFAIIISSLVMAHRMRHSDEVAMLDKHMKGSGCLQLANPFGWSHPSHGNFFFHTRPAPFRATLTFVPTSVLSEPTCLPLKGLIKSSIATHAIRINASGAIRGAGTTVGSLTSPITSPESSGLSITSHRPHGAPGSARDIRHPATAPAEAEDRLSTTHTHRIISLTTPLILARLHLRLDPARDLEEHLGAVVAAHERARRPEGHSLLGERKRSSVCVAVTGQAAQATAKAGRAAGTSRGSVVASVGGGMGNGMKLRKVEEEEDV